MNGEHKVTRRGILGAIGAVGAAGAGAGLGTSALFSDTEGFEDNTLTAGQLDLKVGWEEHYFGGRDRNGLSEATVIRGDPNPSDVDYYLPAVGEEAVRPNPTALNFENSQDDLWDATATEAFPDSDDDGIQDDSVTCSNLESVASALDSGERTEDNRGDPLIQLEDVKPGDFGEITFSFHLCDNPGYVWMQGELVDAAENGVIGPESDDPHEEDGTVELLDAVRARMWYDENCDNQLETGPVDVMVIVDRSISQGSPEQEPLDNGLDDFKSGLPDESRVGLLEFGDGDVDGFQKLNDPNTLDLTSVADGPGGGNTPLPPALDIAHQELINGDNAREDAEQVIVAFTDGGPNYDGSSNPTYSVDGGTYESPDSGSASVVSQYTEGSGNQDANRGNNKGVSDGELRETAEIAREIRDAGTRIITVNTEVDVEDPQVYNSIYLREYIASSQAYAKDVQLDDIAAVANDLAAVTMDEDLFFEGSLRDALDALSSGNGIPLDGDTSTPFNEFGGMNRGIDNDEDDEITGAITGGETDEDREAFASGDTTHCVAFQWWLPLGVGNQIQSDSAEFNLGFYAEQSRNNDGALGP